uniref:Minor capsid protein n=4 Tax=Gammapolyomavirus pypyrrhula TaxID=1891751 RepID=A0A2I6RKA6_9POLY|nr:VP2 [Finch polyomavirus]AUN86663.1 putative VP2 [Gammapolyomavirus pypyrrhula]AUN86669.1 putative VP2 [Gammapolyomavirus pypyrrhula]
MGAVISLITGAFEIGTLTGLAADALVSAESLALLETEIGTLVEQGLSVAEILDAIGVSEESLAAASSIPYQALQSLAGGGILGLQAASVPGLIAAGVYAFGKDPSLAHNTMALAIWREQIDYLFPGINWLATNIHYLDPLHWARSLFNQVGRALWNQIDQRVRDGLIGGAAQAAGAAGAEVAIRQSRTLYDVLARAMETARWTIHSSYTSAGETYRNLREYYAQLPVDAGRPAYRRRLLGLTEQSSWDHGRGPTTSTTEPKAKAIEEASKEPPESGEHVQDYPPPGGAHQRHAPDWLLPLLLGLYGDLTPEWRSQLKQLGYGSQKRKRQLSPTPASPQADSKRRNRSTRRKNRP